MIDFSLANEEQIELRKLHKKEKDKHIADKIKAVILLGEGYSLKEAAKILLLDETTIRRYHTEYKKNGVKDLLKVNYKGRLSKLNLEEEERLKDYLRKNILPAIKEVVEYIKKEFNIEYKNEGARKLLHRLGFVYKKPHIVPSKADSSKQKEFVEKYKVLRENLLSNEKIYFMDGCHPTHNTICSYGWIEKGTEKEIKSNTGRERINLNGVYSPNDNEVIVIESETINAQSTIQLFEKIESKNQDLKKIYIICDNARYYNCNLVKEYLKSSKIELIFLPSYSPNLNLIERLWKFFKKLVLYNKYYEKFTDFKEKVLEFFREKIINYKCEITSLMSENFNIININ